MFGLTLNSPQETQGAGDFTEKLKLGRYSTAAIIGVHGEKIILAVSER
jgi:hypothetical protein